ncbi:hypothetical protein F503_00203 [Ophiostoma piceae UAMH 11346]|uniref:Uncharacterized protein n=1 Tax=Ophiostoma piceae (strain UAMH 11346) TaxID=1262450 RepID=S3BUX6_OPHP1|nr:hypothetical protein F503_00203 [Ophiostoma piceae UAMH 11346]
MDELPGYPRLPGIIPTSMVTPEWLRERRLQVLRWQLTYYVGVEHAPCRKNFEFLVQYYENGGALPPNNVTWFVYDGRFVLDANGERATMRTIGPIGTLKGCNIKAVMHHQYGQTALPAQQVQMALSANEPAPYSVEWT